MACEGRTAEVRCKKDTYTPQATSIQVRASSLRNILLVVSELFVWA